MVKKKKIVKKVKVQKKKEKIQKTKKKIVKEKQLKGLIHFCSRCNKNTEHKAEGERWINYVERCKKCKSANYSEILRKV